MRVFLRKIKAIIFKQLKKQFLIVLRTLDSSFECEDNLFTNYLEKNNSSNLNDRFSVFERTVVINTDNTIVETGVLDFYLNGIFGTLEVSEIKQSLGKKFDGLTYLEMDQLIENFLIDENRYNPNIKNIEKLQKILRHRKQVLKNQNAYNTKNLLNPNAVFWPDPTEPKNMRSIFNEVPYSQTFGFINKETPIVSAGSCFATEIAHSLQKQNYNYLVKEKNTGEPGSHIYLDGGDMPNASAAWGIIFNTPSFRQLVEKAFKVKPLPRILWTQEFNNKKYYLDPFRENIAFESPEAFNNNYELHLNATRDAFLEMKVFIITLGLNEVWYFKSDGSVFSRSPWKTAKTLVGHKIMSVEENVNDLIKMTEILRHYNPDLKIICTLSPVGLHATFRGQDQHVITANAHSKAVLRVAAEEFSKRCPNVFYFPSYEVVTNCSLNPWQADQRHVTKETVQNVMSLLHKMYVQ